MRAWRRWGSFDVVEQHLHVSLMDSIEYLLVVMFYS